MNGSDGGGAVLGKELRGVGTSLRSWAHLVSIVFVASLLTLSVSEGWEDRKRLK